MTSGACTTTSDATCFVSPNFPDNYGSNQNCNIHVAASEAVTLSVAAFTTEFCCDPLTVNGVRYRGTEGPDGVQVCVRACVRVCVCACVCACVCVSISGKRASPYSITIARGSP